MKRAEPPKSKRQKNEKVCKKSHQLDPTTAATAQHTASSTALELRLQPPRAPLVLLVGLRELEVALLMPRASDDPPVGTVMDAGPVEVADEVVAVDVGDATPVVTLNSLWFSASCECVRISRAKRVNEWLRKGAGRESEDTYEREVTTDDGASVARA